MKPKYGTIGTLTIDFFRRHRLEGWIWLAGLTVLAFMDPYHYTHFTLCPFANLGLTFCPGCGLGRSISFLFHGDITASWQTHPLGILAVMILLYRVISLATKQQQTHG